MTIVDFSPASRKDGSGTRYRVARKIRDGRTHGPVPAASDSRQTSFPCIEGNTDHPLSAGELAELAELFR